MKGVITDHPHKAPRRRTGGHTERGERRGDVRKGRKRRERERCDVRSNKRNDKEICENGERRKGGEEKKQTAHFL